MAKYFAGGHLRFIDGEWRDDDGNVVKIKLVRGDKSRCHKCRHETYCSCNRDEDGTCSDYKRDPSDGGYYG